MVLYLNQTNPMQVTEQNKQEAEKVVEKYRPYVISSPWIDDDEIPDIYIIKCAIQDRQSVLDYAKKVYKVAKENATESTYLPIKTEITNLTEQINYLKSKL